MILAYTCPIGSIKAAGSHLPVENGHRRAYAAKDPVLGSLKSSITP